MACHLRSTSIPSRSHPSITNVEEEMHRLRISAEAASAAPQMISDVVRGLGGLHECMVEIIQLPSSHSRIAEKKKLEDDLDVSVKLLDLCDAMKGSLASTKEHIQDLQLTLKKGDAVAINDKVNVYIRGQKMVEKNLKKCFRSLKHTERKSSFTEVSTNTEAREITVLVLQKVASFLTMQSKKEKTSKWSFIAKAMSKRRIAHDEDENAALDFVSLNAFLQSISCKGVDGERVQKIENQLQVLEVIITDVEDGLELLFKKLIESRVSLLNILSL